MQVTKTSYCDLWQQLILMYSILFSSWGCKSWNQVFESLLLSSLQPSMVSYGTALRKGQWHWAMKLLRQMREEQQRPSLVAYGAVTKLWGITLQKLKDQGTLGFGLAQFLLVTLWHGVLKEDGSRKLLHECVRLSAFRACCRFLTYYIFKSLADFMSYKGVEPNLQIYSSTVAMAPWPESQQLFCEFAHVADLVAFGAVMKEGYWVCFALCFYVVH